MQPSRLDWLVVLVPDCDMVLLVAGFAWVDVEFWVLLWVLELELGEVA
jgi:hypothetical protein